jgi:hypothetical protein
MYALQNIKSDSAKARCFYCISLKLVDWQVEIRVFGMLWCVFSVCHTAADILSIVTLCMILLLLLLLLLPQQLLLLKHVLLPLLVQIPQQHFLLQHLHTI